MIGLSIILIIISIISLVMIIMIQSHHIDNTAFSDELDAVLTDVINSVDINQIVEV